MSTHNEWSRSDILLVDLLRLYEQGDFYDCTFQLSSQRTGETKDVKCHKLILSASSCVFAKMFYGNFKEAHLAPDDPIPLRDVTPEVFECAMSVLYSQDEQKFQNVKLAMDVYKFAHEMQIPSVMHAVNKFFKTIETSEALAVLDFCIQMDNKEGLKICIEGLNPVEALQSNAWLKVSESVVQKVLQLDLAGSEVVAAVLKWGRAQVEAQGHDPSEMDKLIRLKIDSSLKLIKWTQFDNKQFSELCQGDLGLFLSAEEKSKIHESIALGNGGVVVPQKLGRAVKQFFTLELPDLVSGDPKVVENIKPNSWFSSEFTLSVNKECQFLGLSYSAVEDVEGGGLNPLFMSVDGKESDMKSDNCSFEMKTKLVLEADHDYVVCFEFPQIDRETSYKVFEPYHRTGKIVIHNDDGDICVTLSNTFEGVKVNKLFFARC